MRNDPNSVAITGGIGYIGSRLAARLRAGGFRVHLVGVGPFPINGNHIEDELCEADPTIVVNLAGYYESESSAAAVDRLLDGNFDFGARLTAAMIRLGITRLVNVGSFWQWSSPKRPVPANLYAALKTCYQSLVDYYVLQCGLHAVTLILYDVYGPDDPRPKLWPNLARSAYSQTPMLLTSGRQRLHLVNVIDVVEGLTVATRRLSAMRGPRHDVFSLPSDKLRSLREIVAVFEAATGLDAHVVWDALPAGRLVVRNPAEFVPRLPGWRPRIDLATGFREMAARTPPGKP